ncbi:hypothetical protein CPB83DRAFT_847715 [Crepidotus variabilis]|uniref:Uncharacterized protein n=1 Tax=Crepidotus variabilis TaxID=179855 RepID=A0A9P6ENQ2_9AGAR|nr:hypothetical protein CPB83DRAFT_847715 [Crepidotus variabilis]
MQMSSTHAADTEYLVRQAANSGYQWSSLLAPPAYMAYVVARRGRTSLSLNKVLRATWVGGLGGSVAAGSVAYARYAYSGEDTVRVRRIKAAYNTDALRRNDHATIGGVVVGALTPAILWKRGAALNLILGGFGIGNAFGLLTHYGRAVSGDPAPKIDIALPGAHPEVETPPS